MICRPSSLDGIVPYARSDAENCDTYQRAYQPMTHGIGMINTEPMENTSVRHSVSSPVALNEMARRVPAMLAQVHRIQAVSTHAQPMMVMKDSASKMFQPI